MSSDLTSPILTPSEAAKWLRVSSTTLERWRSQKLYPELIAFKLGGKFCYSLQNLEKFVASRMAEEQVNACS